MINKRYRLFTAITLTAILLAACSRATAPVQSGNLQRTDVYGAKAFNSIQSTREVYKGSFQSNIAYGQTAAYITDNDEFISVDLKTGKKLWGFKYTGDAGIAIESDGIVSFSDDNALYGLDSKSGKKLWESTFPQKQPRDQRTNQPTVYNGTIFQVVEGSLKALDYKTGKQLWEYQGNILGTIEPVVAQDNLYIATEKKLIDVVNCKTGVKIKSIDPHTLISSMAVSGDTLITANALTGTIYAFELGTGNPKWHYDAAQHQRINKVDFGVQGNIVVMNNMFDGFLYAIDLTTGKEVWRKQIADLNVMNGLFPLVNSEQSIYGDTLYVGALFGPKIKSVDDIARLNGKLYALDVKAGKEKWTYQMDTSFYSSPILIGDSIYVQSNNNTITAYKVQ